MRWSQLARQRAWNSLVRWEQRVWALPLRPSLAVLALFFLVVAAVCWLGVALLGGLPGDAESAAKIREERLGWLALAPAHALDWLGRPVPAAVVVALVAGWVWRRIGWRYALLVIGAAGVTGVTWLIKVLVDRSRPVGAALEDPSFPSGHTTWAVAVFGVLAVLALQRRRWLGAIACVALAGAMGPSRVLLGVHWLSDVIAGYAIGLAWLIALLLVGMPWAKRRTSSTEGASRGDRGYRRRPHSGAGRS